MSRDNDEEDEIDGTGQSSDCPGATPASTYNFERNSTQILQPSVL